MQGAPPVPCGSCTLCCHGPIFLFPGEATTLETVESLRPDGARAQRLPVKTGGACLYLGPDGCTVYDRRPRTCRDFDCRDHYFLPSAERRRREAILTTPQERAVIARGRELVERNRK